MGPADGVGALVRFFDQVKLLIIVSPWEKRLFTLICMELYRSMPSLARKL